MTQDLVIKSNNLIETHLYNKSVHLKLFSRVIIEIINFPDKDYYDISIKDILKELGVKGNNYGYLKEVAKSMMIIDKSNNDLFDLDILFKIKQIKKTVLRFELMQDFKPLILGLKEKYTKYYFRNIVNLNSSYSIRIYELLKQYEKIGKRKMTIEMIKEYLGITEKYKLYGHFKAKVILVAQKEINTKTDINFSFNEIKEGRKVEKINFIIKSNSKVSGIIKESNILNQSEKLGFKAGYIDKLVEQYGINRVERNMKYVLQKIEKGNKIENAAGYVIKAIKHNLADNLVLFDTKEEKRKQQKMKEMKEQEKQEKEVEKKKKQKKEILNFFDKFPEKKKQKILEVFYKEEIENNIIYSKYWNEKINHKNILDNQKLKAIFRNYLLKNKDNLKTALCKQ